MKNRILYIEDEEDLIMMVKYILEGHDYEVITAMDGEEGLRKAEEDLPDLILLDVLMPKMDGFEACKVLKADPATRNIPILMITASVEPEVQKRCLAAGADDYIPKPFDSADLVEKIKSWLSK